jgi:hypothetical protein
VGLMPQLPYVLILKHFETVLGSAGKQKAEQALRAAKGLPDDGTKGQDQAEVRREDQQLGEKGGVMFDHAKEFGGGRLGV